VTAQDPVPLFRPEVAEHRKGRLHGEISIAVPVAWHAIGFTMLAALVALVAFLAGAGYARVETVTGEIALEPGVAAIVPPRPGSVAEVAVRDGQQVRAGQPLIRIRAETGLASGGTVSQRLLESLSEQDRRLLSQSSATGVAAAEDRSRLEAQLAGLRRELISLGTQIVAQRRLVEVAAEEFAELRAVAGNGFISRRDLNSREATLMTRRQQLAQLEQSRSAKTADIAQTERAIAGAAAIARAEAAGAQSSRAQLAQQRVQAEAGQGYVIVAPVDGTVTAVTASAGQPTDDRAPVMIVMPRGARPRAELYVPSRAAGFIAVGQEVRLALDAFPFQSFGTVPARIVRISSVAVPRPGPDGAARPVYLVTAEPDAAWIDAFGRRQPLLPGMTLSARIVTERQSLLHWLFEPLFAIGRR
jgi:membrane fusion protein